MSAPLADQSQPGSPFVGEIRLFAGTYAPTGWATCEGQLLAVDQNDALFSLLGTAYGGDGRTTFGLPDLRGRVPVHAGQGPGLSPRSVGQQGGREQVTLTSANLPSHTHAPAATDATTVTTDPAGRVLGHPTTNTYRSPFGAPAVAMAAAGIEPAGNDVAHANIGPSLVLNFIIALYGIYPSRQ